MSPDLWYVVTGALSLVTSIVGGLLGRQMIARMDHRRDARRGR